MDKCPKYISGVSKLDAAHIHTPASASHQGLWVLLFRLAEALEMDEGGAGAAEAGGALDSYYADGDYGDEKMQQVRACCTINCL